MLTAVTQREYGARVNSKPQRDIVGHQLCPLHLVSKKWQVPWVLYKDICSRGWEIALYRLSDCGSSDAIREPVVWGMLCHAFYS